FCQFVADFQRLLTADAYAEKPTVERFHTRTHSRRATEIPCLREIRGDAEDHYGHCHSNPAEAGVSNLRELLLPGTQHAALRLAGFQLAAAANAIMQMRFHQQSAGGKEFTAAILDQQLSYILTTANRLHVHTSRGRNFLAQALPDPLRSSAYSCVLWLFSAQSSGRLIKSVFWIHCR